MVCGGLVLTYSLLHLLNGYVNLPFKINDVLQTVVVLYILCGIFIMFFVTCMSYSLTRFATAVSFLIYSILYLNDPCTHCSHCSLIYNLMSVFSKKESHVLITHTSHDGMYM